MPTTEEEVVMMFQHILATACQGQLQWVKTLQGADIPTNAQGFLLHFTNGTEFQCLIVRTKRPKTYPVKRKGRTFNVTIPEE